MSLVYSRFAVDIGYSCSIYAFKVYNFATMISKTFFLKNLIFILIWATVIFGIIRTSLLFLISIDRVIALFSNQFYSANRRKLPIYAVFFAIFSLIIFDQLILFVYCNNSIDSPIDCDHFRCSFNECYSNFWLNREQTMFCIIVTLTIVIALKLAVCTFITHNQHAQLLSRVTQIAMIDSTTLILFNLIPIFSHYWFSPADYQSYASFTTLSRNLGFFINTIIIFRIFIREKVHVEPAAPLSPDSRNIE